MGEKSAVERGLLRCHRLWRRQIGPPHVESGLITLIGATTENPSFEVIAPLLSRTRVVVLQPLSEENLAALIRRALEDRDRGLGAMGLALGDRALAEILRNARRALKHARSRRRTRG
jgi:replication-associated recombination protein RarA